MPHGTDLSFLSKPASHGEEITFLAFCNAVCSLVKPQARCEKADAQGYCFSVCIESIDMLVYQRTEHTISMSVAISTACC